MLRVKSIAGASQSAVSRAARNGIGHSPRRGTSRRRCHLQNRNRKSARRSRASSCDRRRWPERVFRRHVARSAGRMRRRHIRRSRYRSRHSLCVTRQFARKAIWIFAAHSVFPKRCPSAFKQIRLHFDLDTDASEEQRANLIRLTERYCVVYQTLKPAATHRRFASRHITLKFTRYAAIHGHSQPSGGNHAGRCREGSRKDMEMQRKYGVEYHKYWVNENGRKVFCLAMRQTLRQQSVCIAKPTG